MNISGIIWLEDIVDKLEWKHNVNEHEVIELLENHPQFRFIEKGHQKGENVYAALGQTDGGRYLIVFFVYKKNQTGAYCVSKGYESKGKEEIWGKIKHQFRALTLTKQLVNIGIIMI